MYCLKCRVKTDSKKPSVAKENIGKLMILSICAVWDTQKLRFIKEQEASGLLNSLGTKTPSSKLDLVGPLSI